MAGDVLLTFNAGSSTIKIGLYELGQDGVRLSGRGKIDFDAVPLLLNYSIEGRQYRRELPASEDEDTEGIVGDTLTHLLAHLPGELAGVGHRVVHGGLEFFGPVLLTKDTISRVRALTPLAPLHQPAALRVIDAIAKLRPELRQTASFDTAFHASQHELAQRLAIPRALHDKGVRRYGFHGLSYKFIAGKVSQADVSLANGKVIVAHLGSGASVCALFGGLSRDCSMGFSALDGIPMATRPGWLDAGVLLHLMRNGMSDPAKLEEFLYHECGLLDVSGISADIRDLLNDRSVEARQAVDLFCFRIAGEIARQSVTLGGPLPLSLPPGSVSISRKSASG